MATATTTLNIRRTLTLLAAALVVMLGIEGHSLASAPAAHAYSDGEYAYIADMTRAGMGPPVSIPMFLGEEYGVCADIRNGAGLDYEASVVRKHDTGLTESESRTLVSLAIKDLCPDL